MTKKTICRYCGREIKEDEAHYFDDTIMCESCFNDRTSICEHCGRQMWTHEESSADNYTLCPQCYETYYTTCEECGTVIRNSDAQYFYDDDTPYCIGCFDDKQRSQIIHDYNYKPEPIFHGNDNLFMGIELEIDNGGEYTDNAERILQAANQNGDNIYCKHDGSIEYGFEIVSHPMTLNYHMNCMNWENIFNKAIEMGYRSHQTDTCGLHIHINRNFFGSTYEEQEAAIARVVYFVEAHWNELLKFSRRTEDSIMRWATRYGILENAKATYNKVKKSNYGRYVSVNLQNPDTIEFRIFKGTLKYKTFIATLQLVHELCVNAKKLNDKNFESLCWGDFVLSVNNNTKSELIEYLKCRCLYINEPIECEEDM